MSAKDKGRSGSIRGKGSPSEGEPPPRVPVYKQLLFSLVAVAGFFVLLEIILFIVGLRPVSALEDPYVGFSSHSPLFVEEQGGEDEIYLATARNKLRFFQPQRFPLKKSDSTYRIFCMGGSTTYGRPYDDLTSFCGWLRMFLPKADPSRHWEVINAGGISYASYRVALLMQELSTYDPDLFIIYSGQNEFLERRTYSRVIETPKALRQLGSVLSRTRTYTAIKQGIGLLGIRSKNSNVSKEILPGEVETMLERSVGPESYHRDDEMRNQVLEHYQFNLARMIDIARSAGADVVLVAPGSNLRDCSPFKSENHTYLTTEERSRFLELLSQSKRLYDLAEMEGALALIDEAQKIDSRHAELHFLRGKVLWGLGRYDESRDAFIRARDEDICPLRALTEMEDIVKRVAAQKGAPVVDFAALVADASQYQTPGNDLFLDHVHPTIDGHRMLALALLDKLSQNDIAHPVPEWGEAAIQQVTDEIENRLDNEAHGIALRNLARVLRWAGKHDEALQLAQKSIAMVPQDTDAYFVAGSNAARLGRLDEAEEYYLHAIKLKPNHVEAHNNLGRVLAIQGKSEEAILHYRRSLEINSEYAEAHYNLGIELAAQDKLDEAIRHYKSALKVRPDYPEAHFNLATVLQSMGDLSEAIDHYRHALRLNPELVMAHNNLANVFLEQNKYDEALDHYRAALRLSHEHVETYNNMGTAFAEQGKLDEAIGQYLKAVEVDPQNVDAHYNLGRILAEQGQFDRAIPRFRKVLQIDKDNAEAHFWLANALGTTKQFDEAIPHFQRAMELKPEWPDPLLGLSLIFATHPVPGKRDFRRATKSAEKAAQLTDYKNIPVLIRLADVYAASGRLDKAIKTAEDALGLAENSKAGDLSKRILRQLELYRKTQSMEK